MVFITKFACLKLFHIDWSQTCLLYTSDAADEGLGVDLGGRRIIKKKLGKPPKQIFGKREVKCVYEIIVQQDENFKYPDVQVASHG